MTASSPSLVLVHAQEQLKGKLSLTPLSRFDIQLYHVQRHLAGQETCKPWEPMRQGSLVHNYSITGTRAPGRMPVSIWRPASGAARPKKAPRGVSTAAPARSPRAYTACARKTAAA